MFSNNDKLICCGQTAANENIHYFKIEIMFSAFASITLFDNLQVENPFYR